ncbi:MAG: lipopolysaccharide biosynthesis protein [Bacteroidales bacterium]
MTVYNKNKIIANTFMLYVRMFVILSISLFTVRLLLKILGVVDYGVYSVVGSLVSIFAFLSDSLSTATQRFFAIEIAKNDLKKLNELFNIFLRLYFILAIVLAIIAEVIGMWLLQHYLNIPSDRFVAAKIVFHASVITFCISILTIPFQALIIAFEKMNFFALISILEASMKLGIVMLLSVISFDKLVTYGLLVLLSSITIASVYFMIIHRHFKTIKIFKFWDINQLKKILSFSGWNIFGSLAAVLNIHGINILINIFFGPLLNASRGIAVQVNTLVNQFVMNFSVAVNPQITKLYAIGDIFSMQNLVYKSSKFSFLLILIPAVPLIFETEFFLSLWLGKIPAYTAIFIKLILLNTLIDSLSYSFRMAVQATAKIKYYQIIVGGLLLFNVPVSYIFYKLGYKVEYCFYVSIAIALICMVVRLLFVKKLLNFSVRNYLFHYVANMMILCLLIILLYNLRYSVTLPVNSIIFILFELVLTLVLAYFIGLNSSERTYILGKIKAYIKQI